MVIFRKKPREKVTKMHPKGIMTLTLFKELFLFEHKLRFEQRTHTPEQLERLVVYFEKLGYNCAGLKKSFNLS